MNRVKNARNLSTMRYVPHHSSPREDDVRRLQNFVDSVRKIFVLTGAGMSTESGIPDYRSEKVGLYATSDSRPVQYQDFLKKAAVRKRLVCLCGE
jgi:NAD-dependent deacetylase sirtuin 4